MFKYLGIALFALMLPVGANATLVLSPSTGACGSSPCLATTGNETGQPFINAAIASFLGYTPTELYKDNVGGIEEGPATGWYTTTYMNSPGDPADADIVWDGGSFISDPSYLLVKDGAQTPAWYLFDISSWDGMEKIELRDFWPNQGAISHVTIYGGGDDVPEPGPLGLLGAGMIALYIARRRRLSS